MNRNMIRLTYPHLTGCGCASCCKVDAAHESVDESVAQRIAEMSFTEKRGLLYDYKDLIQGKPQDPGSYRQWLRDRVADQLIAKAYDSQRSWY